MATAEPAPSPQDRASRRRPFAAWIKRVTNLKSSSHAPTASKSKKSSPFKNNPYPESGHLHRPAPAATSANGHLSFSEPVSRRHSYDSDATDDDIADHEPTSKSAAPTLATNPETIYSDAGQSKAETSNTRGGAVSSHDGGGNSTFSSPNHSERSLTTTLTTIQSTAPSALLNTASAPANPNNLHPQSVHFSHQYPVSPASAVPAHLQPQPHPHTYQAATAGNILSDNASIMTLASSSKRRRRNSLDTNASVRALAPSSVWGGSRESLPLSVLSGNVDTASTSGGIYQNQNRPGVGGMASAERASVYSSSGAAPALSSERNSYYASKQGVDTGSVRSGLAGHGRAESLAGSVNTGVGGPAGSPLTSPVHAATPRRMGSRRSSSWKDDDIKYDDEIEEHEEPRHDGYDNDEGDPPTSINGEHVNGESAIADSLNGSLNGEDITKDVKAVTNGVTEKERDIITDSN